MNLRIISSTLAALAAFQIADVDAHGYLVKPVAEFLSTAGDITQYSATFQGTSVYPSGSFSAAPADNVKSFITNFADGQYNDIKTMILKNQVVVSGATADCGFSTPKTKQTLSSSVWWGKNTDLTGEGFVESHEGPCEAWCDDVMVMQNTNCATAYNTAGKAAEVPIDNSKCSSASQFTFYWIAMHTNEWQVYINCLALSGSTSTSASTTTTTPTTTTATPVATTVTSTATTATPTSTTATPVTTTKTPTSITKKPTSTTKNPTSAAKKPTTTTKAPMSNNNGNTNKNRQGSQRSQTSTGFATLGNYTTGSVRPHN